MNPAWLVMLSRIKLNYTKEYGALSRKTRMRVTAEPLLITDYKSQKERACVESMLANLIAALLAEDLYGKPFGVKWAKNQEAFKRGDPHSAHLTRAAIKILHREGLVDERLGFCKAGYEVGRPTILLPTKELRNRIVAAGGASLFSSDCDMSKVYLETKRKKLERIMRPSLTRPLRIINRVNAVANFTLNPCAVLATIAVPTTTLTTTLLCYYNSSTSLGPDSCESKNNIISTAGLRESISPQFVYRRKFKWDLKSAGRFVADWQNLRRDLRAALQVNGEPMVELDYSAMHPRMAMNLAGEEVRGDVYDLGGPIGGRLFVKRAMNVAMNADSFQIAIGALNKAMRDDEALAESAKIYRRYTGTAKLGAALAHVLERTQERYPAIAGRFYTNAWRELQYLEAEIVQGVMLEFAKRGVPCLGLHDSFLVPESEKEALREAMTRHYKVVIGTDQDPVIV